MCAAFTEEATEERLLKILKLRIVHRKRQHGIAKDTGRVLLKPKATGYPSNPGVELFLLDEGMLNREVYTTDLRSVEALLQYQREREIDDEFTHAKSPDSVTLARQTPSNYPAPRC